MNHWLKLARFATTVPQVWSGGLLSRSGVWAAVMTHCVGEQSQVVRGIARPIPPKIKIAFALYPAFPAI